MKRCKVISKNEQYDEPKGIYHLSDNYCFVDYETLLSKGNIVLVSLGPSHFSVRTNTGIELLEIQEESYDGRRTSSSDFISSDCSCHSVESVFDAVNRDEVAPEAASHHHPILPYRSLEPMPNLAFTLSKRKMTSTDVNYYLDIAQMVSKAATCMKTHYGAVIIDGTGRVISTGYTGAPETWQRCADRPVCDRIKSNMGWGKRYDLCRSVHAEQNAILNAREDLRGCILFLAGESVKTGEVKPAKKPCIMCQRMIANVGIEYVFVRDDVKGMFNTYPTAIFGEEEAINSTDSKKAIH